MRAHDVTPRKDHVAHVAHVCRESGIAQYISYLVFEQVQNYNTRLSNLRFLLHSISTQFRLTVKF